ncbi:MAG: glycosyltransferase family 39 protein [Chloroflexi bacterium]|nr:glycosyltransferase family 39 protein [Chloroflexota bacterium]
MGIIDSAINSVTSTPERQRLPIASGQFLETLAIVIAFVGILLLFRGYTSDTAGGSDSYGHVSEALRLSRGHFYEPERVLSRFGLPEDSRLTFPIGSRPQGREGTVPTYPFGYPLLMATAIKVAGLPAAFWVTPLLAAGAILLTYLLGRWWLGRAGGSLAALLTVLLPNFLWGSLQPMSDVPATFFSALALVALFYPRPRPWSDLLLGGAVGFAIWVRPNMVLLVAPVVAWLLWRREKWRLVRFGTSLLPFVAIEGLVNHQLYGAPWTTGYVLPLRAPIPADLGSRMIRYLERLDDQQAGVGLFLVLLGLGLGRLALPRRAVLAGVAGVFLAFFSYYPIDDAWWYGRFLLPGLPAVAVLESAGLMRLQGPGALRRIRVVALVIALALFSMASVDYARAHYVFVLAEGEAKYQLAARFARERVQEPALILTSQHSGSLRLYGDLATARHDTAPVPELLATLRRVVEAGGSVYFLGDGWEVERILKSDRSILLAGAQELGRFEPSRVTLFRLKIPLDPDSLPNQHAMRVTMAGQIALLGSDLSPSTLRPGEKLTAHLYWQAIAAPEHNYTVFIHLVDEDGQIVTQSDGYPVEGRSPTAQWTLGYAVRDTHQLTIPPTRPPGTLKVIAGLYRLETMDRLLIRDGAGTLIGDHVAVGSVDVWAR